MKLDTLIFFAKSMHYRDLKNIWLCIEACTVQHQVSDIDKMGQVRQTYIAALVWRMTVIHWVFSGFHHFYNRMQIFQWRVIRRSSQKTLGYNQSTQCASRDTYSYFQSSSAWPRRKGNKISHWNGNIHQTDHRSGWSSEWGRKPEMPLWKGHRQQKWNHEAVKGLF